jgi:hypothetical protein
MIATPSFPVHADLHGIVAYTSLNRIRCTPFETHTFLSAIGLDVRMGSPNFCSGKNLHAVWSMDVVQPLFTHPAKTEDDMEISREKDTFERGSKRVAIPQNW